MTKPRPRRPEPTTGTNYDTYLVPRSKTPEKNTLIAKLLDLGWRFDSHYMEWHTPEKDAPAFGRLEYAPDFQWARVQPPNPDGGDVRGTPLLRLGRDLDTGEWIVLNPKESK